MESKNQLNAWANPAPAGLVALAVSCFCFFALFTNQVTDAAKPLWDGGLSEALWSNWWWGSLN